tara:strand:+ start:26830 stop:27531 length:702 start_codon:yes stop_codon:yes gene_type:complete
VKFKLIILSAIFAACCFSEPIAQKVHSQGVKVEVVNESGTHQFGSGVAFKGKTEDDIDAVFIITCAHVLIDSNITGERTFPQKVIARTPKGQSNIKDMILSEKALEIGFDCALLVATNNTEIFNIASISTNSLSPRVGEDVYIVGNPNNIGILTVDGMMSANNLFLPARGHYYDIISTKITHGFSGGGVFRKSDGKYVGLVSMMDSSHFVVAIPSNQIRVLLDKIKIKGIFKE